VTKPKDYYLDLGIRLELFEYMAGNAKRDWLDCGT
jgi:hypothetical protein